MMNNFENAGHRVVVTGLGVVTPVGIGIERFWEGVVSGKSGIKPVHSFDVSSFNTKIAGEIDDFVATDYLDS